MLHVKIHLTSLLMTAALALICLSLGQCCTAAEIPEVAGSCRLDTEKGASLSLPEWKPLDELTVDQTKTSSAATPTRRRGRWAGNPTKFFEGAFIAFLGHESGHLMTNVALDTDLFLKSVNYGPIPFFTIEPGRDLTQREHYIIASAGFNAQHIINEWLLAKHPNLRKEDEPLLKGMATFNFWLGVGYAGSALTRTGPNERDTKGMADSLGWNERSVGTMILVPTLLDAYRYKHPDAKWAKKASRITKAVIIGLALAADNNEGN